MPLNIKPSGLIRKNTSPSKKSEVPNGAAANSPPSERKSPGILGSGLRGRQPLSRGSTDSTAPTLVRKPSQASIISTVSKADKKRTAWRGVAKSLPQLLKSSRGASSTSLVSQDVEPAAEADTVDSLQPSTSPNSKSKIPIRRTTLSPKASILADIRAASPPNAGHVEGAMGTPHKRDSDERTSAEFSDGSRTMVEDTQATVRALSEELSATQQQLTETKNECSALREHIRSLESSHNTQLRQSVEEAVNHTKDELLRAHGLELDKQKDTLGSLQKRNEDLASRIMVAEDEKTDASRTHASEVQSLQFRMKNLQESLESLQHELKVQEEHAGGLNRENSELRGRIVHLEQDGRVLAEGGAEAQKRLLDDVNHYRHQLEEAQKLLVERDTQVTQLQTSNAETENLLVCAQSSVDEKDKVIGDLQRQNAGIEERNRLLESRFVQLEGMVNETKNAARRDLQASVAEYERRLTDADKLAHSLRSELASSTTNVQQLRVALDTARADSRSVLLESEEHVNKLRQVQDQHTVLQEKMRVLDEEKKVLVAEKAELIRTHAIAVEVERRAVHNLRRSIETAQRDSSSKEDRTSLLVLANEELRREIGNLNEEQQRKEEEISRTRKELEVMNAKLGASEEENRLALETAKGEKEKLVEEMVQLRHQLEDVQGQLSQRNVSPQPQPQGTGEGKLKGDLQKAIVTIEEQKTVIGRLQQSVGERSKEERSKEERQPSILMNMMKGGSSRSRSERSRSSSTASHATTTPAKASSSRSATSVSPTIPPRKVSVSKTSPTTSSSEGSKMLRDQDRAFQTGSSDSESERSPSSARRQVEDIRRIRQQTEASLVYRMGHAVFGSLWKRVWG